MATKDLIINNQQEFCKVLFLENMSPYRLRPIKKILKVPVRTSVCTKNIKADFTNVCIINQVVKLDKVVNSFELNFSTRARAAFKYQFMLFCAAILVFGKGG